MSDSRRDSRGRFRTPSNREATHDQAQQFAQGLLDALGRQANKHGQLVQHLHPSTPQVTDRQLMLATEDRLRAHRRLVAAQDAIAAAERDGQL